MSEFYIDPWVLDPNKVPIPSAEVFPEETPESSNLPPQRIESTRRAFVSFATRLSEMIVSGEINRPIEKIPAYLAAEQYYLGVIQQEPMIKVQ